MGAFLVDDGAAASVGGFAGGELVELAEEAATTGDHERDHHAVTDLQVGNPAPGFFDDAHEFVAENVASFGLRDPAVVQVQVRTANGCGGDSQDDVVVVLEDGIRNIVDANVLWPVVSQCSHGYDSCGGCFQDGPCRGTRQVGNVQKRQFIGKFGGPHAPAAQARQRCCLH